MGPFLLAALVVGTSIVTSISMDIGVNTLQNWYDTVYADAFWSSRPADSPALRALAKEESEIDRLMREQGLVVETNPATP
jgi:hypothetical protein